jgi:transposase
MIALSSGTRVHLAVQPVDLRGSFNALSAAVKNVLRQDPLSGQVFVFTNRRRTRLKALFWDGSGLWVCGKRLERGRFAWPRGDDENQAGRELRPEDWSNLVHGLEVISRANWLRR